MNKSYRNIDALYHHVNSILVSINGLCYEKINYLLVTTINSLELIQFLKHNAIKPSDMQCCRKQNIMDCKC